MSSSYRVIALRVARDSILVTYCALRIVHSGILGVDTIEGVDLRAFADEVAVLLRQRAVVLHTVDAVNFDATLVRNLRKYVGGNPIVLAITRFLLRAAIPLRPR